MPTEQRRHTVAALVTQIAGPMDTDLLVRGLAALEDAVSALRDQLAATTARADRLDLLVETERGRIVMIEAKAVAAEQGRDRAEAQAAELRALLEQAEAAAEKARREAVHEARKAAQAFDALQAVEAARLAQGLLARLRAAPFGTRRGHSASWPCFPLAGQNRSCRLPAGSDAKPSQRPIQNSWVPAREHG